MLHQKRRYTHNLQNTSGKNSQEQREQDAKDGVESGSQLHGLVGNAGVTCADVLGHHGNHS